MKVCMVGEGAMGNAHMGTLSQMQEIEVVTVAGGLPDDTTAFAEKWKIPNHSLSLEKCLSQGGRRSRHPHLTQPDPHRPGRTLRRDGQTCPD